MQLAPETLTALITLLSTIGVFAVMWLASLRFNDASIVDWVWAGSFAMIAWITLARQGATPEGVAFASLVTLWAVRLSVYMIRRHLRRGYEDPRYAAMRAAGGPNFRRDSLWKIFILQALILWVVATPIHAALLSARDTLSTSLFALGAGLFAIGLALQAAADAALVRFASDPANRGKLLTDGLFAWSRHPNYFGESVVWFGAGIMAYAMSGAWWAFVGPMLLTFLLVKVSGVTMTDSHLASRPGWADYAARTSAFIPWPPKRRASARQEA